MSSRISQLREQILRLAEEYYDEQFPNRPFVAGESPVCLAAVLRFLPASGTCQHSSLR
jgi:hypothetical protein